MDVHHYGSFEVGRIEITTPKAYYIDQWPDNGEGLIYFKKYYDPYIYLIADSLLFLSNEFMYLSKLWPYCCFHGVNGVKSINFLSIFHKVNDA